ncbi:CotH kinase family protein [Roseibacillus persicicus]|uniref:CotH kinase family protein n=1 Tax=Roseibacillus persicicus TaxID=454148 RepID=UPI00280E9770|nr:CotH kinase family protein [Roseibacillus persicicus]MDQ8190127.1 CotH kinase family protein [Roseibacillus persicicus]
MRHSILILSLSVLGLTVSLTAQERPDPRPEAGPPPQGEPRGERGPGGGGRGPGGPQEEDVKLLAEHDRNEDGWLNAKERAEAREALKEKRDGAGAQGRRGGRRGPGNGNFPPASAGPKISPEEVESYPDAPLYDAETLRTIFLTFPNEDWEEELQEFKATDVEVPATMVVDGKSYSGVGVSFRGASSYFRIPAGHKRSFNLSLDLVDKGQRLYGHKSLNLLNGNGDPSLMSTVLYSQLAREHIAAPKANFVKVVVNGEYWGVYVNVEQFDKVFTKDNYGASSGTRWKVPGSPRGDGGLAYDGEELAPYKTRYDMKSNDGTKEWEALVELCKVLNETPLEKLEEKLAPLLAIDETLWFLAYDVVLGNSDGYWTRASDYYLFRDKDDVFHTIPHDMNEAFREGHRGNSGAELDPLIGLDDARKPLRSRLLKVPALRERYLGFVREIAEKQLAWDEFGAKVNQYRKLIEEAVKEDTRKLATYEAFQKATITDDTAGEHGPEGSLQRFVKERREYLLNYEAPEE